VVEKQRTKFEELRVYRLAEQVADLAWEMVRVWPSLAQETVGRQLVRAADSIGANIAEGVGRGSFQDNRRFVRIARGSLYETKHWLRRAFMRQLLTQAEIDALKVLLDELAPTLNAYLRSITALCSTSARSSRAGRDHVGSDDQRTTNNGPRTTNHEP
jgi:four helix bundle protein